MFYACMLLLIAALICVVAYVSRGQRSTGSHLLRWSGVAALVVVLTGCGSGPAQTGASQATPTTSAPTAAPTGTPVGVTTAPQSGDWTTYHYDNARTGYIANTPDPKQLNQAWAVQMDGAVYGQPLVVGGHLIVATEGDTIYSLDANTGKTLWQTHVGTPVPRSSLPCGNIDPLGITGTPVYDPATNMVFAVAEIMGGSGPAHIFVGIDATSGQMKVNRPVDLPGMQPTPHQERASLALYQGRVYFNYGGLDGDCAQYIGRVVSVPTSGQGQILSWTVPTPREGGIWAPPGPVIDSNGKVYVSVGNGEVTQGDWDHSDSVLRFSSTLQLEDGFAPTNWASDNAADLDLSSMSPVLLPNNLIFIAGKSGQGYLLHANALGGIGGQIQQKHVCASYGGAATQGSQIFLPCTNGVMQVKIGSDETITTGWHAKSNINGSPIVGGHTVYSMDHGAGMLYALDIDTGNIRASVSTGVTSRFTSPTLSGNHLFIGTMNGIAAITIS